MTAIVPGRDGEVEAFVVDRYLESLLRREPDAASDAPADLQATARLLATTLPRFHPSFRFEEELARRLAAAAGRMPIGQLVAFPHAPPAPIPGSRAIGGREVVVGSVLTSAALSLAGALFLAWRSRRTPIGSAVGVFPAAIRERLS
jgi:hypothetical protein